MSRDDSPITLDVERPQSYNRLAVLLRMFVVAPHLIVFCFIGGIQLILTLLAWGAILVSGRYPEGLYTASLGIFRWSVRLLAYVNLLSDDYPPLSPEEASDQPQRAELEPARDVAASRSA